MSEKQRFALLLVGLSSLRQIALIVYLLLKQF